MNLLKLDIKEFFIEKIKEFKLDFNELKKIAQLRLEFFDLFPNKKIKFFEKEDCMGYQLEWGTRAIGSIKGGSMVKYAPKE